MITISENESGMTDTPDLNELDTNEEPAPERFVIVHDDYHARFVGRTCDGEQFFITTPFTFAGLHGTSGEFVARYIFDDDGVLIRSTIVPLGARQNSATPPGNVAQSDEQESTIQAMVDEIGPVAFGDIEIAPFSVTEHGQVFGMILHGRDPEYPEDDDWAWNITLEPGNFMAFYSPWDSGEYDT